MARQRVSPFDQGSAERVLFDRYRRDAGKAKVARRHADMYRVEAEALEASCERYAQALRALGHGDKVPGQAALPAPVVSQ